MMRTIYLLSMVQTALAWSMPYDLNPPKPSKVLVTGAGKLKFQCHWKNIFFDDSQF